MRHSCCLWTVSFPTVPTLPCVLSPFRSHGFALSCTVPAHLRFAIPAVRYSMEHTFDYTVTLFSPLATSISGLCLLRLLLTSHSSLLLRLMRPPVRPPRLRCGLFPSIYLPHLLVLPATFGLRCFLPSYPYFPALYVVSVRQVRGLPTASFRFHLTVNTLAVQLCASSLPTRTRDFHPLEPAHGGRTRNRRSAYQSNLLYISV